MAFSPVAWAYGDVFSSAKAAQMEENIRSHDHLSTGQGANLKVRDVAGGKVLLLAGVGLAANSRTTVSVQLPAGRFSSPPKVVGTLEQPSGSPPGRFAAVAVQPTAAGGTFDVTVNAGSTAIGTGGLSFYWHAVENVGV